jgi:DnaK suppressor protein
MGLLSNYFAFVPKNTHTPRLLGSRKLNNLVPEGILLMNTHKVAAYRQMLESKRSELIASHHNPEAIVIEKVPDSIDEMVLASQRDIAIDALNRKAQHLSQVSDALLRLDEGSYGLCLECGTAISERRLNALPWAALCLTCQEAVDRQVMPGLRPSLSDAA